MKNDSGQEAAVFYRKSVLVVLVTLNIYIRMLEYSEISVMLTYVLFIFVLYKNNKSMKPKINKENHI